jgi:hypothetical protein
MGPSAPTALWWAVIGFVWAGGVAVMIRRAARKSRKGTR